MSINKVFIHAITFAALTLPVIVFAHGEVPDGHVEDIVVNHPGASALLQPFSSVWWGLLGSSALLTALLSFGVWKFLRVPPVKSTEIRDKK